MEKGGGKLQEAKPPTHRPIRMIQEILHRVARLCERFADDLRQGGHAGVVVLPVGGELPEGAGEGVGLLGVGFQREEGI